MTHLTSDPSDPRLGHGVDTEPTPQNEAYLVLSDEERARGFVRPVRRSYRHVGALGPLYPTVPLSPEQIARHAGVGYVAFEAYPESGGEGMYWTQARLDNVGVGCDAVTTMGVALAETYARDPLFYGSTYCVTCQKHLAVGEFIWDEADRLGAGGRVGS